MQINFIDNNTFIITYFIKVKRNKKNNNYIEKKLRGIIDYVKNNITIFKENIKLMKINIDKSISNKLKEKNTAFLKKYLKILFTGILLANNLNAANINLNLNKNPDIHELVTSTVQINKIDELEGSRASKYINLAKKNVKIFNVLEQKLNINFKNTDLTNSEKKELEKEVRNTLNNVIDKLRIFLYSTVKNMSKEEIDKKLNKYIKQDLLNLTVEFVDTKKTGETLAADVTTGYANVNFGKVNVNTGLLIDKNIFQNLKSKGLLKKYIDYFLGATILHELVHGAGIEFKNIPDFMKDKKIAKNLFDITSGNINAYDDAFNENLAVYSEKFYFKDLNKNEVLKDIIDITKIINKDNPVAINNDYYYGLEEKEGKSYFKLAFGFEMYKNLVVKGDVNPKNLFVVDKEKFDEEFKNMEKKYKFLKIFEKQKEDFKTEVDNFISFQSLQDKNNIIEFSNILKKIQGLRANEHDKITINIINSLSIRPLVNIPVGREYGGIIFNNNKNIIENIIESGYTAILNEDFNNNEANNYRRNILNYMLTIMKLNPDKFTPKDFELVTKLYLEEEASSLYVKYSTLEETLEKKPELKPALNSIKKQYNQLKTEIDKLKNNLSEKIKEDYIFYKNIQKIMKSENKLEKNVHMSM